MSKKITQPPRQDTFDKLLEDLFNDLQQVYGNRQTHSQLQRVETVYRERFNNLKPKDNE